MRTRSHSVSLVSSSGNDQHPQSSTSTTTTDVAGGGGASPANLRRQRSRTVTFEEERRQSSRSSSNSDDDSNIQSLRGGAVVTTITNTATNSASAWLPRTPHRGASIGSGANSNILLTASAGITPTQLLSHQKQPRFLEQEQEQQQQQHSMHDDDSVVRQQEKTRDASVGTKPQQQQQHADEDDTSSGAHYEVLFPPTRPQFSGLIYEGDPRLDKKSFRSALSNAPATRGRLLAGVQKRGVVWCSLGSVCRHHVVAAEGGDMAFVPLLRQAMMSVSDEVLRVALPRCFDVSSPSSSSLEGEQQQQEDPVSYFRKHIFAQQQQHELPPRLVNQQHQPNCIVVSLRAGIPHRSEETARCVITTCNLLDNEPLVVDPMSIFRAFDDEHWVAPLGVPAASVVALMKPENAAHICKRLVGEIAVPRYSSSVVGGGGPLRPSVELTRWPRSTYHHGVGGNVKQNVGGVVGNGNNNDAAAAAPAVGPLVVTYPARLLELRPCAALNGELEVVAGPLGIPYGTALVYGGTLATPKKNKALGIINDEKQQQQQQQQEASIVVDANQPSSSSASSAARKSNSAAASTNSATSAASASTPDPPVVDVEKFIYSYEVGSHGRVILGNTVARYINHKLNFSPSGNVQFVNLPPSKIAHLYPAVAAVAGEKGEEEESDDDDGDAVLGGSDDDNFDRGSNSSGNESGSGDDEQDDDDAVAVVIKASAKTAKTTKKSKKSGGKKSGDKKKKKKKPDADQQLPSSSDMVLPFFLVARDIAPGEPLLADSYGSSYDEEMERFVSCGSAPMSAVDVEAVQFLKQQQQRQQQQQQVPSPPPLPQITCGYDACYRTGVDRGSIVACVTKDSSTSNKKSVSVFYVHAACWGDVRQPKNCVSPDDPQVGALFFLEDEGDNNNGDDESLANDKSLLFAGIKEEDLPFGNKKGGTALHTARMRKYFARSVQNSIEHHESQQQQQQSLSVPSAVRSCRSTPRFILAERLVERTAFTVMGEREIDRLTGDFAPPGSGRIFFRAASPAKLHAKSSDSNNAVSLAINALNKNMSDAPSSPSSPAAQLASSLVLLDAACCVLMLPQRDGIWPVTFNPKETGIKKQTNSNNNNSSSNLDLECVLLTAADQMEKNAFVAAGGGELAAHDAVLFPQLRTVEPRISKTTK